MLVSIVFGKKMFMINLNLTNLILFFVVFYSFAKKYLILKYILIIKHGLSTILHQQKDSV